MIGFQYKKNHQISYGLKLQENIRTPQKISMCVVSISHHTTQIIFALICSMSLKMILKNSPLLDQY